jgi:hypothetical protein
MPVIACPGCGKQYKIAATAAGQVAKCACGKRFRLGAAQAAPAVAVGASAASAPPKAKSAPTKPVAPSAPENDDFWDDALAIADKPKPPAASSESTAAVASAPKPASKSATPKASKAVADTKPKKKRKKSAGPRWGFDWGKVAGGLVAFLTFGGIAAAIFTSTGRISIYLTIGAIGGLFTALNGLMGEEGIW